MSREFVPYEEALALKELGFDEECFKWVIEKDKGDCIYYPLYDFPIDEKGGVPCPLYQQAFRWFRDEHDLFGEINLTTKQEDVKEFEFCVLNINEPLFESDDYKEYEEAELECLRKLIEIVKQR